mmetsp:Transcript_25466/g.31269  ORF Transcript_25466/g.31269 Transcript_25466/m.31269 type:complete len:393 (-) Transcript_25466:392-1570(-)
MSGPVDGPVKPFGVLRCHGDQVSALCFLKGASVGEIQQSTGLNLPSRSQSQSQSHSKSYDFAGVKLASGNSKGRLSIWDVQTKRCDFYLEAHQNGILELLELPGTTGSGSAIASEGRDGYIHLYDLESLTQTSEPKYKIKTESRSFCRFSAYHQGNSNDYLFSCSGIEDENVHIWSSNFNGNPIKTFSANSLNSQGLGKPGMCMDTMLYKYGPSGRLMMTCLYESGLLATADVMEERWINNLTVNVFASRKVPEQKPGNNNNNVALCFDALYKELGHSSAKKSHVRGLCGGSGKNLVAFGMDSMKAEVVKNLQLPGDSTGCSSIKIRPDRKIFAVAGWDNKVHLYTWKKLTPLGSLIHHTKSVQSLSFGEFSSQKILASGGSDGHIALWDVY